MKQMEEMVNGWLTRDRIGYEYLRDAGKEVMEETEDRGIAVAILAELINRAGIRIEYTDLDGEIYGRTDTLTVIQMPIENDFRNDMHATMVLGHEMGHILTGGDSGKTQDEQIAIEATCDLCGVILYRLAEMIAGEDIEKAAWGNSNH